MNIQRALLSVSDKTGIVDFARGLVALGAELLSTGGTAATLRAAGLPVTDVSTHTGHPEILDGRVKTLHPKIHGGILQRPDHPADLAACAALGIPPIDLVCANLYPFRQTPGIENIDIGGPSMLRSAAKNHAAVLPVCDPVDYPAVLDALRSPEGPTPAFRRALARKVFALTAAYDEAIATWLAPAADASSATTSSALRYGENPHQTARFLPDFPPPSDANLASARVLHGKEMSYNNYVDGDAALETVRELLDAPAAVIIKHTNPCGAATGPSLAAALASAWEGDAVSAYGSVIALSRPVDLETASFLKGRFVEALIAPSFLPEALDFLKAKSKLIRLISLDRPLTPPLPAERLRRIHGASLVQSPDLSADEPFQTVSAAPFPPALHPLVSFGIRICKHLKSNAILLAREHAPGSFSILGMGAGQPNRVDALRKLAIPKALENMERLGLDPAQTWAQTVLISDAFFPFADNVEVAAATGIRYLVEPGGSKHDPDCIAACDRLGLSMIFTATRHFLH